MGDGPSYRLNLCEVWRKDEMPLLGNGPSLETRKDEVAKQILLLKVLVTAQLRSGVPIL
jgi:hypothetical protein